MGDLWGLSKKNTKIAALHNALAVCLCTATPDNDGVVEVDLREVEEKRERD